MTVLIPKKNGIEYAWDSHLLYFEEEIMLRVRRKWRLHCLRIIEHFTEPGNLKLRPEII
jgi:hypothetical protein